MTRREALLLSFAALNVRAAGEFWNDKKPEAWTDEEIKEMLTKSPWAKEAAVTVFGGAGGSLLNRNGAMNRSGNMSSTSRQRANANQTASGNDAPDLQYKAIARWDSALPVREALKKKAVPGFEDNYIIALIGDLALADADADENQKAARLDMMKEYTKLDRKGGAIPLVNMELIPKEGTLFYFPRSEPMKGGQVTFMTKLGPVEVKCKFELKEMMYRGKLEL